MHFATLARAQARTDIADSISEIAGAPDRCVLATMLGKTEVDQDALARAIALWGDLSPAYRAVFNAALALPAVLLGFCRAPGSLDHHHAFTGGTLLHSVEVAEIALGLVPVFPGVHRDVVALSALLHDAGKALEYRKASGIGGYRLSNRGRLIGHKITTVQLLTTAFWQSPGLPEAERLAIVHAITASHAPDHVDLRSPRSPEAVLLSLADRVSSQASFLERLASPAGGWGRGHAALRGRVFTLPDQRTAGAPTSH